MFLKPSYNTKKSGNAVKISLFPDQGIFSLTSLQNINFPWFSSKPTKINLSRELCSSLKTNWDTIQSRRNCLYYHVLLHSKLGSISKWKRVDQSRRVCFQLSASVVDTRTEHYPQRFIPLSTEIIYAFITLMVAYGFEVER